MTAYLLDWAGLLVRWFHVIAGIAWIGSSFYFVWLDNSLEPLQDPDPRVAGELWAVHGGGFYRSRKYKVAPEVLPPTLHWFYWEAYTTWLSGFGLLVLLYFLRAEAYLIDPAVMALSKTSAILIALGVIVGSWLVYDGLCRSSLGRMATEGKSRALGLAVALVTAFEAWGLCQVFGGRGAFMVFGAAIGSIMVANVLFIIIPGQRELVKAAEMKGGTPPLNPPQGREPDPGPGLRGKQRSVHNTYFTLPVLFVMISNHYAMTYGAKYNWLVLIAMSFAGACIRGWFVARHKPAGRQGLKALMPVIAGGVTLVALVVALAPASGVSGVPTVDALQVQAIVGHRCVPCHSKSPTQAGFAAPPLGITLETMDELRAHLPEVEKQVSMRAMPLGNLTGMTDSERAQLLSWIHD